MCVSLRCGDQPIIDYTLQCQWIRRPSCCSGPCPRGSSGLRADSLTTESKAICCWRKWVSNNQFILSGILIIIVTNIVIPVIGEVDNPAGWVDIVKDLDAVIQCVGGTANIKTVSEDILLAVSKAAKKLRPEGSPKLTYIHTSGTWVHGDNRDDIVTDTTPLTPTNEVMAPKSRTGSHQGRKSQRNSYSPCSSVRSLRFTSWALLQVRIRGHCLVSWWIWRKVCAHPRGWSRWFVFESGRESDFIWRSDLRRCQRQNWVCRWRASHPRQSIWRPKTIWV